MDSSNFAFCLVNLPLNNLKNKYYLIKIKIKSSNHLNIGVFN